MPAASDISLQALRLQFDRGLMHATFNSDKTRKLESRAALELNSVLPQQLSTTVLANIHLGATFTEQHRAFMT